MTPQLNQSSICDNCGLMFEFDTGTIIYDDNHEPLLLCPECYEESEREAIEEPK